MNNKPRKFGTKSQPMHVYTMAEGGGCIDVAYIQMAPGVSMYHEHTIEEMWIAERTGFIPYLLSVLANLGHQAKEEEA